MKIKEKIEILIIALVNYYKMRERFIIRHAEMCQAFPDSLDGQFKDQETLIRNLLKECNLKTINL